MSYITFKTLGQAGDLGSQIQQYASLCAIAKHTGKRIVFPKSCIELGWGFKFNKVLDVSVELLPDDFFKDFVDIAPKANMAFDADIFNLDKYTNYNITELLHIYRYWWDVCREDVANWNWKTQYFQSAQDQYNNIKLFGKETVAIHVRRGDYTLPQHHHFCQLDHDYYWNALQYFLQDIDRYQFIVFSNDIQWCRQNLIEEGEIVTFLEPGEDFNDLVLMSLCNHNIVANSSYSWWAAFRNKNPNKKVICPTNYIKQYSPANFLNGNYYPSTWINIDNTK